MLGFSANSNSNKNEFGLGKLPDSDYSYLPVLLTSAFPEGTPSYEFWKIQLSMLQLGLRFAESQFLGL